MNPTTLLLIGVVLGLVGLLHIKGILGFFGKKKTNHGVGWFALVVGAVFILGSYGIVPLGNWPVLNMIAPSSTLSAGVSAPSATTTAPSTIVTGTQTPTFKTVDADQLGTSLSPTSTIYKGALTTNNIVTTTSPGSTGVYTVVQNLTNYLDTVQPFNTPSDNLGPTIPTKMKALDTSVSFSAYNSDGRTANSNSANQTLTASSSSTMELDLTPSALYKHIAGGPNNQFDIFLSATNSTNWDTTKMSLTTPNGWATCTPYNGVQPQSITRTYVYGWTCTGDFSGTDTAFRAMNIGIGASSTYSTGGTNTITVSLIPVDYYTNTINGNVEYGPVKNDGSAIQTSQTTTLYLH